MGGKNRAKKLAGSGGGATSSKKKGGTSVKLANKTANKAARQQKAADLQARGSNVDAKKASKATNKADRAASRKADAAAGGATDAESRKKKATKRKHGNKNAGAPSVKQMKQHAHEPRAMRKHDETYNARQQAKADKRAGRGVDAAGAEEEDEEPEANAADSRFFARNEGMAGFLDNLNADDLSWSKEDRKKPKPRFPEQAKAAARGGDSEDEEGSEDDEEDDEEGDSEDEGPAKKKARGERGVASFERTPRRPSWAADEKEAKARLPVRAADGSWVASEVTKADTLRARAERLELMQRKGPAAAAVPAAVAAEAASGDEDEDAQMDDAAASASEDEQEEEDEDAEPYDSAAEGEDEDEYDDTLEDEDMDAELEVQDAADVLQQAEPPHKIKEQMERRHYAVKLELAESSELVLENPDKHLGKMEPMLQLCTDADPVVMQLALLSCVEVLVDLLPSYRIRMPSEEEMAANLSKEVKATWKFERSYLLYYGRTVTTLLAALGKLLGKHTNDRLTVPVIALNLLRCACKLLERGYHFNYRKELVNLLAPLLNHAAPKVRLLVFQTLVQVFRADIAGESTLEVVRVLAKIVKERGRKVQVELLQIFLYLPLHKEILQAQIEEKKAPVVKKKGHSFQKIDDRALNKDLAESEATVSLATRKKIQTALLTEIFTAYFRILKQDKTAKVLPVVLRGLSKFATLIDVDLVLDLLDCLKTTITRAAEGDDGPLSVESTLYVILTSFQTLQSHGQALAMDLKEFYNCLYALLFRFCDPVEVVHIPLLLQCLHLMFHETKQLSLERVAAFLQRLCALALYVPPYACLSLLHAVRLSLNKYPKCKQLLDREVSAPGVFLAELDDPDVSNAMASTLWELGMLKAHYHPFIPVYAQSVLEDAPLPLALSRTTPTNLFENYDSSAGGFNPPLPLPAAFLSHQAGGSGGTGTGAATSTTMRKKLDLRRRMRLAELEMSQRDERFQSPFLRELVRESRAQAVAVGAPRTKEQLQAQLAKLQEIQSKFAQFKKQQPQQQQKQQGKGKGKGQGASNGSAAAAKANPPTAAASSAKKQKKQG